MNTKPYNPVGKFVVLSDYSWTDRNRLMSVITRFVECVMPSSVTSFARVEVDEQRRDRKKRKDATRAVYVMQVVEVHYVNEETEAEFRAAYPELDF